MDDASDIDIKLKLARARARARMRLEAEAETLPEGVTPDSPLAKALREQPGDVVETKTPEGETLRFTRKGERVASPEDVARHLDGAGLGMREEMLKRLLSLTAGGGGAFIQPLADVAGGFDEKAGREAEAAAKAAESEYPKTSIAGAMLSQGPIGAARTVPLRMLAGGLSGAMRAAPSGADFVEAAKQAGMGFGVGALAQGAGEALGVPLRAAAGKLGQLAGAAKERTQQAIEEAAQKAIATEKGHLGRLVASQSLGAEKLEAVINAPPGTYTPETVAEARRILSSPEGRAMLNRVASNAFDKLREAFGAEPAQREALAAAVSAAQPEAVAGRLAGTLAPEALARDLGGRAWRSIAQRALLGAGGAALGSAVGGPPGAFVGGITGGIAPGMLQMMRNVAKAPKFQWAAAQGLQSLVAEPAASVAQYLTPGVAQSVTGPGAQEARSNAYRALQQKLGLVADDDEDLGNKAFIAGQTSPAAQPD